MILIDTSACGGDGPACEEISPCADFCDSCEVEGDGSCDEDGCQTGFTRKVQSRTIYHCIIDTPQAVDKGVD